MTEHVPSQLTDWHLTEVTISLGNPSSMKKPDIAKLGSLLLPGVRVIRQNKKVSIVPV